MQGRKNKHQLTCRLGSIVDVIKSNNSGYVVRIEYKIYEVMVILFYRNVVFQNNCGE